MRDALLNSAEPKRYIRTGSREKEKRRLVIPNTLMKLHHSKRTVRKRGSLSVESNTTSNEPQIKRLAVKPSDYSTKEPKVMIKGPANVASDTYHWLRRMSWPMFLVSAALLYIGITLMFAGLYIVGPKGYGGFRGTVGFWEVFFYSAQTMSSGAAHQTPNSLWVDACLFVQGLVFVVFVSVLTGLIFTRFSKPVARVRFAKRMVVTERDGDVAIMMRVANERSTPLENVRASMMIFYNELDPRTKKKRRIWNHIPLLRNHNPVLHATWDIIHIVTDESLLFGLSKEGLGDQDTVISVKVEGTDTALNAPVSVSHQYGAEDIFFCYKFEDIYEFIDEYTTVVDLYKFDDIAKDDDSGLFFKIRLQQQLKRDRAGGGRRHSFLVPRSRSPSPAPPPLSNKISPRNIRFRLDDGKQNGESPPREKVTICIESPPHARGV